MNTHEVLKLALEALENALNKPMWDRPKMTKTITAIKEALAQPEQEPVAWEQFYPDIGKPQLGQEPSITKTGCGVLTLHSGFDDLPDNTKFYTTPPQRPWVGLTDEETDAWFLGNTALKMESGRKIAQAIEAKLKELNT